MQRISEPQMVEAFTRSRTSPCPAVGTGVVRNSTVLSPGRNAAVMVSFISIYSIMEVPGLRLGPLALGRCDLPMNVPEIFPTLVRLPEKNLPFYQAAVSVDPRDLAHLFVTQRIAC